MELSFWGEEHQPGDYHYHLDGEKCKPKYFFTRVAERIGGLLPEGFGVTWYHAYDFGVTDTRRRQHMHLRYRQRTSPQDVHSIHLSFMRAEFKEEFERILRSCFRNPVISWD